MKRSFALALSASLAATLTRGSAPRRADRNHRSGAQAHLDARHGQLAHLGSRADVLRLDRTAPHRHAAGTQASDWVMKNYRAWGIDAQREQYGTWRGWRRGYSHIDLIKPRVRSLEAMMLGDSPGTARQGRRRDDDHPADGRRQQRVREVAAEREGQVRAHLGGVSDLSSGRRVGGDGDAGVQGAHGHDDRQARRAIGRREFATPAIRSPPAIRPAISACVSRRPARPA